MKNKIHYIFIATAFVLFLYFFSQIYIDAAERLQIVFLDVGQGDSILIQKGTHQILIDGGPSGKTELAKLGSYLPYFDREIEIAILTHPDRDHIAGLVEVARNYKIGKVLTTAAEKDTAVFREWKELLAFNKIEVLEVVRGDQVDFGEAMLKIIFPESRVDPANGDGNNDSVVARFDFGESSFLFTGDIESPAEQRILASGENIDVDFLKIAHHGSRFSSGDDFLDATSPEEAIISVGAKNSYGHPTEAVLNVLEARGTEILRTDEMGDIVYICRDKKCIR